MTRFELTPLKYLSVGRITNGVGLPAEHDERGWPRYIRTTDIAGPRSLRQDVWYSQPPDLLRAAGVRRDDLLLTNAGATIGKSYLHVSDDPSVFAGYLTRVRPDRSKVEPRFLAYFTESQYYWDQINLGATRSTIDNFSSGRYQSLLVPKPPLEVQRRIANYLDTETARIDGLLALNRRRRSLIQERLWAQLELLIEGALTPVGYLVRRIEQGMSPVAHDRAAASGETGVLKLSAISRGRYLPWHNKVVPEETSGEGLPRVRPKSLLLSRANTPDRVGDVAYVDHDAGDLTFPDLMFQLLIDERVAEPRYVAMALTSRGARAQIEAVARGSSQSMVKLRQGDVRELRLPVPGCGRQVAVAEAFEGAAEHARSVDDALERASDFLVERRQALVTAAVTGDLEV